MSLAGWADAWSAWMGPVVVQSALLAAAALALERLLARWWTPPVAAAAWSLVLARLLLPPGVSTPVALARVVPMPAADPAEAIGGAASAGAPGVLLALWSAGVAAASLHELHRRRRLHRHLRACARTPVPEHARRMARRIARELGLQSAPPLRLTPRIRVPAVVGARRPVVLLPDGDLLAPRRRSLLEHALYHELAHVRRRDLLRSELLRAVAILYWFHPAAWIARRRLEQLAEIACDGTVARTLGARAGDYRQALLEAAALRMGADRALPGGASGWIGRPALIVERLRALDRAPRRRPHLGAVAGFVLLAPVLVPCAPARCAAPSAAAAEREQARARALDVLQRAADGERPGCFALQHAAFTLMDTPRS